MNDDTYTITIGGTEFTNDTGSEYLNNVTYDTSDILDTGATINLDNITSYTNAGQYIDPTRVVKMSEHYPALAKAWENFYSIYKMVDQDYKGNHEKDEEIPF